MPSSKKSLTAKNFFLLALLCAVLWLPAAAMTDSNVRAAPPLQEPTAVDVLTPPYVECCRNETFANLRTGPNAVDYPGVGVLTLGETVKVIGKSKAGSWIQVLYPSAPGGSAWVYAELVILYSGEAQIPVVEAPPTPMPKNVATLDPTFAAQFVYIQPTRLPTFTPATAAPTITMQLAGAYSGGGGLPPAVFIIGLLSLGAFGAFVSAVVRR